MEKPASPKLEREVSRSMSVVRSDSPTQRTFTIGMWSSTMPFHWRRLAIANASRLSPARCVTCSRTLAAHRADLRTSEFKASLLLIDGVPDQPHAHS